MSNEAAELLAELRQDHRNMAILLGLLRDETDRIDHDELPDFELLHDIMRYMTVYSDAMHHPKEDLIYDGMRQANPELAAGLYDKLTGRDAEISYSFDDFELHIPSSTAADAEHAHWKMNGTLRVTTRNGQA